MCGSVHSARTRRTPLHYCLMCVSPECRVPCAAAGGVCVYTIVHTMAPQHMRHGWVQDVGFGGSCECTLGCWQLGGQKRGGKYAGRAVVRSRFSAGELHVAATSYRRGKARASAGTPYHMGMLPAPASHLWWDCWTGWAVNTRIHTYLAPRRALQKYTLGTHITRASDRPHAPRIVAHHRARHDAYI